MAQRPVPKPSRAPTFAGGNAEAPAAAAAEPRGAEADPGAKPKPKGLARPAAPVVRRRGEILRSRSPRPQRPAPVTRLRSPIPRRRSLPPPRHRRSPSAEPPARRRRLSPRPERLVGSITSYNSERTFGFVRCEGRDDVYFQQRALPPDAQAKHGRDLVGTKVEFELHVLKDGKHRCERMRILEDDGVRGRRPYRERPGSDGRPPPPPMVPAPATRVRIRPDTWEAPQKPLDEPLIGEMTRFLERKRGVMDYGKFSSSFPGFKKSQLEAHFTLVPEVEGHGGGRWQIMIKGVSPLTPEERAAREAGEVEDGIAEETVGADEELARTTDDGEDGPAHGENGDGGAQEDLPAEASDEEQGEEPLKLEPSATLRLLGHIKEWDGAAGSGLIATDGYEDVVVESHALPTQVQGRRSLDLEGCEVSFEMEAADDGILSARDVHLLLQPDLDGRWQLRRL